MLKNVMGIKIKTNKPDNLNRVKTSRSYCAFVGEARKGKTFYTSHKDINCPLARFNLGLEKFNKEKLNNLASTLVAWNDAESRQKARHYIKKSHTLDYGEKYIIYFPLKQAPDIEPDIVMKIGTPQEFMPIIREVTKLKGDWTESFISGVGGMCGEATAIPLKKGKVNISLGCGGSRLHGKLAKDQLIMALPYKIYEKLNI